MKKGLLKMQSRFYLQLLLIAGSISLLYSACSNRNDSQGKSGSRDTLQNPYKPSPPVDKYGARPADFKSKDTAKVQC